jgi:hypothetical protein
VIARTDWQGYSVRELLEVEDARTGKAKPTRMRWPEHVIRRAIPVVEPHARSPKGDSLAWRFDCNRSGGALPEWVILLFPFLRRDESVADSTEIWVSRIDGTGMRRLGWVPAPADRSSQELTSVEWSPDGRNIRFVYKDALYEMDAD